MARTFIFRGNYIFEYRDTYQEDHILRVLVKNSIVSPGHFIFKALHFRCEIKDSFVQAFTLISYKFNKL